MTNYGLEILFWVVLESSKYTHTRRIRRNETNTRTHRQDTGSNVHTKKDGSINWKDTDDIEVQLAGTFAADRFIVIKNRTKDPVVSAEPHPYFDYEKKVFTRDGREEYMEELKALDEQYMKEQNEPRSTDG